MSIYQGCIFLFRLNSISIISVLNMSFFFSCSSSSFLSLGFCVFLRFFCGEIVEGRRETVVSKERLKGFQIFAWEGNV